MCGILGLIGEQHPHSIESMSDALLHRGPDDSGFFRGDRISLGQRRLSIVDIGGGHQPMTTADGRFVLVYNGEIYNAAELRVDLERDGVVFDTDHSDTEVLLRLLIRDGEEALKKLNGMFAFALLDREQGQLFCARDRVGIKPFYYAQTSSGFAFASELKALLTLPEIDRKPDLQSLFHYFSLQYIPGERTSIEGVSQLRPGTWLRVDINDCSYITKTWWQPEFTNQLTLTGNELTEYLSLSISEAVDRWSISDVPVGCLLSGGLDSSAIVSLLAQKGHDLKTYTVGFSGPGEAAWDEMHLARKIADKWGTEHREIILDPDDLLGDLVDMVWSLDEPYGGGLPSWSVFKAMGGDVKVAVTGTGGDELFGNYNKFARLEGRYRGRVPGLARTRIDQGRFEREWFSHYSYMDDVEKRDRLLTSRFDGESDTALMMWQNYHSGSRGIKLRDRVARLDMTTQLPDEFLMMTDRFSMAHSIEARTPLLDHELLERVYSIPASVRLNPGVYKPLLRNVVKNLVPSELMAAPKRGFVIPLELWLRDRLLPLLRRVFAPQRLAEQGLIRSDFFACYVEPHVEQREINTNVIWSMLMFQLWWDLVIEERPKDLLSAEIRGVL